MMPDAPPDELWRRSPWPDVIEEENQTEKLERKKEQLLLTALRIANGIIGLRSHGAYKDFAQALNDMKKFRVATMLQISNDRQAAVEQGRCLEIQGICDLIANTEHRRDALAEQLAKVQATLADIENQRPKQGTTHDRTSDQ